VRTTETENLDPGQSKDLFYVIKDAIDGRSPGEIAQWSASFDGGVDALLDQVFARLPDAFLPDQAEGKTASFQFEIDTHSGIRSYWADVHDDSCEVGSGSLDAARVTMSMDLCVFLEVLTGLMHPVRAFLTRKIRTRGDMMTATKFETWFARP
jgi:putative sterol carrier protein